MAQRILQIIPTLDRSGAEKQLVLLACGLPRDEFDVHVCALTRGGPLQAPLDAAGIPTSVIGKRWKVDPGAWWRLRRHIAAVRPDLVQTWLFAANAYGRAAALSAGVPRVVASERCVDPWKTWRELLIDRRLARRTDRIIVNSSGVADFYIRHGLPAEKFRLIPNGIEPAADRPPPDAAARQAVRTELGLPPGARLIAAVGRLWRQKRVRDLICAIGIVSMVHADAHLLIMGDGPLRRQLERLRDDVHLQDQVHFLGARDDVSRLLPHCEMLCLTSGYEGLPNVVMEAMAAGLPVVASDIPGNRDLVVPETTGLLFPVGDRSAIARSIHRLLEDPDLGRRWGAAGRQRIETEFTVARMVRRHANLYRELLHQ
jgi:glycosyltransferase involved in cell wall biosynthesis